MVVLFLTEVHCFQYDGIYHSSVRLNEVLNDVLGIVAEAP